MVDQRVPRCPQRRQGLVGGRVEIRVDAVELDVSVPQVPPEVVREMRVQREEAQPSRDGHAPDGAQDPATPSPGLRVREAAAAARVWSPARGTPAARQEPRAAGVEAEGGGPEAQGRQRGPAGAGNEPQGAEADQEPGAGEEETPRRTGGSSGGAVLIPARNEAAALPGLLADLAVAGAVDRVLVVDNGSTDGTAEVARDAGARVVRVPRPGYGRACQRGLRALASWDPPPRAVLFLDADDRAGARQAGRILGPVLRGSADLVTGARRPARGVPRHARIGNGIVGLVFRGIYGWRGRDVGPLRAAHLEALAGLELDDPDFGWNVQMQVRAFRARLRVREVPVEFAPRRSGRSKISGSPAASVRAGWRMLAVLVREVMAGRSRCSGSRSPEPGAGNQARAEVSS